MKTYEEFNKLSPYKIYWCINVNELEDSFKKIEEIIGLPIITLSIYKNLIKTNQNYCYLSINRLKQGGWNPLIHDNKEASPHYYYGDQIYKDQEYKFGGYINCTEEEVKNYIENYEFIKKYNL